MKNKIITLAVILLVGSILFGCVPDGGAENGAPESTSALTDTAALGADTTAPPEKEAEYYSVKKDGDTYSYEIYNKDGTVAEEVDGCEEEPFISLTDALLVRVTIGKDTYYYDLENCIFSDTFTDVFDENGTLMVKGEERTLVICDIFDEGGFYKALDGFSYELSQSEESPFISCEFIDGGGSIRCVYLSVDGERLECFNITDGTKYVTVADWKNQKELISEDERSTVESFLFGYMGTVDYNTGLAYAYDVTGILEINGKKYYHCECFYLMEEDGSEERVHAAEFVLSENFTERYDCRDSNGELTVYTENNMM